MTKYRRILLGSFQRDTEGDSIGPGRVPRPKLEKGPDLLARVVERLEAEGWDPILVGDGTGMGRRQYLQQRLGHRFVKVPPPLTPTERLAQADDDDDAFWNGLARALRAGALDESCWDDVLTASRRMYGVSPGWEEFMRKKFEEDLAAGTKANSNTAEAARGQAGAPVKQPAPGTKPRP